MSGIPLKDAAKRTGLTVWQLRKMAYRGGCRWKRDGRYVVLHPEDVAKLERNEWKGRAVE